MKKIVLAVAVMSYFVPGYVQSSDVSHEVQHELAQIFGAHHNGKDTLVMLKEVRAELEQILGEPIDSLGIIESLRKYNDELGHSLSFKQNISDINRLIGTFIILKQHNISGKLQEITQGMDAHAIDLLHAFWNIMSALEINVSDLDNIYSKKGVKYNSLLDAIKHEMEGHK